MILFIPPLTAWAESGALLRLPNVVAISHGRVHWSLVSCNNAAGADDRIIFDDFGLVCPAEDRATMVRLDMTSNAVGDDFEDDALLPE